MINWRGMYTLFRKELLRFLKVIVQTVLTPVVTAMLYLVVFAHLLDDRLEVYPGFSYSAFLIPGLIIMTVIQNAFANSSSSLIQSKMIGNVVFMLLAPISALEFYAAFVAAAVVRGVVVGAGVYLVAGVYLGLPMAHPGLVLVFAVLSGAVLGGLGVIAGVWADQFERLAAFQNFVILPLSFLSGVFYSIHSLPELWHRVSLWNPFFYMIDGFRYAVLGVSDVAPERSLVVAAGALVVVSAICIAMLATGYKIRK